MTFAMRLSKSVPMTFGIPDRRFVSTLTPLPVGSRNEVILPMERDQLCETSSAVIRSCRE